MPRILITGFYDWKDLGEPPQIDRCKENPSGRLLANKGRGERGFYGPLACALQQWSCSYSDLTLDFKLLPVVWDHLDDLNLNS